MPSLTKEAFDKFAEAAIFDIKKQMRATDAIGTGKTLRSLEFLATDSQLRITGGKAFTGTDRISFIESGRGKSNRDEGGVLYPAILEWVNARGIGTPKTRKSIAYAITKSIHGGTKKSAGGTKMWKQNKMRDIVQSALGNDRIEQLYKELGNTLFRELESQIVQTIRQGASIR